MATEEEVSDLIIGFYLKMIFFFMTFASVDKDEAYFGILTVTTDLNQISTIIQQQQHLLHE